MAETQGGRDDPAPLRVLLVSDGPFHTTGYGIQAGLLAREMVRDGHRVFIYSPGGFHNASIDWIPGVTILGSQFGDDRWGNRTLAFHVRDFKPDLILTWLDPQGLVEYGWSPEPTYMWAPIDTWPMTKQEMAILNRAERVFVPSVWGQRLLAAHGIDAGYIPCAVDMGIFDIDKVGRKRWRSQLQPPVDDDTFLIGMVGLNTGAPDRKGYGFAFDAISQFRKRHSEADIRAYVHTNPKGDGASIDLTVLREEMGLLDTIYFPPDPGPLGSTELYMRDMYNAFDVFLHTALTEGFGLPIIEAQACGTPCVVNACTAITELVEGGYKAEPLADMIVNTSTRIALPDVRAIVVELERAYFIDRDPVAVRASVLRYSSEGWYDRYWKPILADVPKPFNFEEDSGPRKLMLAAGSQRKEDFVHHDRWRHDGIDVGHDLNLFPWPWDDDSWDYIEFPDCLEHLRAELPQVMDELHRILAPGGHVYIHTAHAGSWQLMKDPTHIRGFDMDAMDYFDPKTRWGQTYSYTDRKWRVVRKTMDNAGGLMFVLTPRKDDYVPVLRLQSAVRDDEQVTAASN